jgi:hypothetical protein
MKNPIKIPILLFLIAPIVALTCVVGLPQAQALNPAPDGGYPGDNTAEGTGALFNLTSGVQNTAIGAATLHMNTTGNYNTAVGDLALTRNVTGRLNTAVGIEALANSTDSDNVALGTDAGKALRSGNGNVYIGSGVQGVLAEDHTTRIKNVYASQAAGRAVYVNSDNKIGTLASSRRYKEEITPMGKASETLFALQPVTFRYKKQVDAAQMLSFGLVAEDVAEANPELVTLDTQGKPETVRYEAINAMLLNEFLKEHRRVEQMEKQIEALTAGLQKVSAELAAASPSRVADLK